MARIKPQLKARPKRLYPNGWPKNMRAVLYLNQDRKVNPAWNPGQPLQADSVLYGETEMSLYG